MVRKIYQDSELNITKKLRSIGKSLFCEWEVRDSRLTLAIGDQVDD